MKALSIAFSCSLLMNLPATGVPTSENRAKPSFDKTDGMHAVSAATSSKESFWDTQPHFPRHLVSEIGLVSAVVNEPVQMRKQETAPSPPGHPTYLRDVLPIFIGKCFRCHNDQTRFLNNWSDYNAAVADRWEIRRRIWDSWKGDYFKQPMPTMNSPESEAITEQERALIKAWVDSGATHGTPGPQSNPRSKAERLDLGKALFTTICAACHQPTGQGIPTRFPPLAGSDFLNSNKERAIGVLVHGLQGEVVVNGQKFNNSMPLLPLDDGQIAAALTYVYSSFGNSGKDVTPEEVKASRSRNDWLSSTPEQARGARPPAEKSPWE